MFNLEELNSFLIDTDVTNNIVNSSELELSMSLQLETLVEQELLLEMNKINALNSDENRVNQSVFILFAQAIKSFKACIILAINGYFTNVLINCRNIVEIIFNIKYIVEDPSQKLKKANDYLSKKDYWTDDTIKHRAFMALDKPLYENVYNILCNYSHSNYMGTAQNYNGKNISINPNTDKVRNAIEFTNSLYFYLIQFIYDYFSIKSKTLSSIHMSDNFCKLINFYSTEKNVLDFFFDTFFSNMGLTQEQKVELKQGFKNFTIQRKRMKK